MIVKQIVFDIAEGLKKTRSMDDIVAQHKDDGGSYCLHIENHRAFALTSKRVSAKTGMLVDKIDNFENIKNVYFPFKALTIIVVEVSANHLTIKQNKRRTTVVGIMGSLPEKIAYSIEEMDLPGKEKLNNLRMLAHDVIYWGGKDVRNEPYWKRLGALQHVFPLAGKWGEKVNLEKSIVWAAQNIPLSEIVSENDYKNNCMRSVESCAEAIKAFVDEEDFEHEGVILKDLNGLGMIKIKKTLTVDCVIVGFTEGKGKYSGQIGAVTVALFSNYFAEEHCTGNNCSPEFVDSAMNSNNLIVVGNVSGINENLRLNISNSKNKYIGKVVEVECMEWTGKKLFQPRIKCLRDDKMLKRCNFEQVGEDI